MKKQYPQQMLVSYKHMTSDTLFDLENLDLDLLVYVLFN